MKILGLETSCDDTSVALLEDGKIRYHQTFNQNQALAPFGGVVPEISARIHSPKILAALQQVQAQFPTFLSQLDLLSVTQMPGLMGPLLTGITSIKTLSLLLRKPIYPANHLYAHLEAIFLTADMEQVVTYPYLGLLVSGGHTQIYLVKASNQFTLLAQTLDDAAGEAFDKGGKLLHLAYPAGKIIDEQAKLFYQRGGGPLIPFPTPMENDSRLATSFSGIKTALRNYLQKINFEARTPDHLELLPQICASYQWAIVETILILLQKVYKHSSDLSKIPLVVGGGVALNSELRRKISNLVEKCYIVSPEFCSDNGAMIANLAYRNASDAIAYPASLSFDASSSVSIL